MTDASRRKILTGLGAACFGGGLAATCSPIQAFNAVAGRDAGVRRVVEGAGFGASPRHRLDVYAPRVAEQAERPPVIMFIYGGSWQSGRREDYAFVGSTLAASGFVTVIPDYRLVPQVTFPAFLEDGAMAARWIVRNAAAHGGDPGRIALVGHSAGAYNAVMLALDTRYVRAQGVDPGVIRAVGGLAGPYDFFPFDAPASEAAFGRWPRPEETQPVNLARRGAPPMFLATGDADDTVRPRNTFALAERLRARGVPVEQRIYPGVGHAGILTGLSRNFRGGVREDLTGFLRAHLAPARLSG